MRGKCVINSQQPTDLVGFVNGNDASIVQVISNIFSMVSVGIILFHFHVSYSKLIN